MIGIQIRDKKSEQIVQTLIASSNPTNNAITRKGGGSLLARSNLRMRTDIVVDVREFMSSLPVVLHQNKMRLVPLTLEVVV